MRVLCESCRPASAPKPLTILTTPAGRMSCISSITRRMVTGVCSAGFMTTQLPAASAGASFQAAISREVPGNDLAHHAVGLVEVIAGRCRIQFSSAALPGP